MLKNKNIFLYCTLAILSIFTLGYFAIANKISYAFEYDAKEAKYENTIFLIKKGASNYAENNKDLFEENNTIYVTVDTLAKEGYVLADEDGNVKNPNSEVLTLNDLKLKLTLKNDNIMVKILQSK